VALRALGHFPVDIMTDRAVLGGMLALVVTQLLDLRRMAGKAGIGQRTLEGDLQRSVRVRVTCLAPLELKVGFALVALIASGNIVLRRRPVACVAILTGDRLVFRPVRLDIRRLAGMAFHAITGTERNSIGSP
jgi:hypothetical protein